MSAELRDFRGKITVETELALEAMSRAFKRDKSDIAREVLHTWALRKIMEANVMARLLRTEGLNGAVEGTPGSDEL
jgi:hypothetical protein